MHYICEIVMPPTSDVEKAIETILKPFNEQKNRRHGFWDFFVIGGRFAGQKFLSSLDKTKLDVFYAWCDAEKVTVSGLTCGKQEIKPADQIPKVDAKWNELFPENGGKACPLFNHSNNQYDSKDALTGDICQVKDLPKEFKASRLILACPSWSSKTKQHTGKLEASFMLSTDIYNGVNYIDTAWDGNVSKGVQQAKKKFKNYAPAYKAVVIPKDDWLSVTVDYHS
jgi:hypothetical protein